MFESDSRIRRKYLLELVVSAVALSLICLSLSYSNSNSTEAPSTETDIAMEPDRHRATSEVCCPAGSYEGRNHGFQAISGNERERGFPTHASTAYAGSPLGRYNYYLSLRIKECTNERLPF